MTDGSHIMNKTATSDVIVPAPKPTAEDLENLERAAKAPIDTDTLGDPPAPKPRLVKNVTPRPKMVAAKSKAKPKATKPKAAKVERKPIKRVPAATFVAYLEKRQLTKTDAAKALGVSNSSISEYSGFGRKKEFAADRWPEAKAKLDAYAKKTSTK